MYSTAFFPPVFRTVAFFAAPRLAAPRFAAAGRGRATVSDAALRADARLRAVPVVFRPEPLFFSVIRSVYGGVIVRGAVSDHPDAFHQNPQIIQSDSPVDLGERTLDHVLQLERGKDPGSAQGKKMPPRLGRETPPLVRTQYSKSHIREAR